MYMSKRAEERVSKRSRCELQLRSFAVWVVLAAVFLTGSAVRGQTTGEWQARSSSGTAVWSEPSLDVSQFSGDIGAATAACIAALPTTSPKGGTCDARAFAGTMNISTQLVLQISGTPNPPIVWLLPPGSVIACTTSSTPCIKFGDNVSIECGISQTNQFCMIQTNSTSQTILGPVTPTSNRKYLYVRGVNFSAQQADNSPVVDLTDTSHATIQDSFIANGGGSGSGVLLQIDANGSSAFYNAIMNTYISGGDSAKGIDVENGANELKVFGGIISSTTCAVSITNTSGSGTDGLHIFGTSAEVYSDAALCSKPSTGSVYDVDWTGGRWESTTGTGVDITPTGSGAVSRFYILGVNMNSNAGFATNDPQHAVTWLYSGNGSGATDLPDTFSTVHTVGVGGLNQVTGSNLAGTATLPTQPSAFNPNFKHPPICTATDTSGKNAVQASATTSQLTLAGTSGDTIAYICIGNPN